MKLIIEDGVVTEILYEPRDEGFIEKSEDNSGLRPKSEARFISDQIRLAGCHKKFEGTSYEGSVLVENENVPLPELLVERYFESRALSLNLQAAKQRAEDTAKANKRLISLTGNSLPYVIGLTKPAPKVDEEVEKTTFMERVKQLWKG